MSTTFTNSLDSDPTADFYLTQDVTTVTYPGEGILFNTGGAGVYTQGLAKKVTDFAVAGMYFQWTMYKSGSTGNCYAFAGIRKDINLAATGVYGVYFSSSDKLESIASGATLSTAVLDTDYVIRLVVKSNNTLDLYVDGAFVENINPGTEIIGQPINLQLGAPYYSPLVGYKDVIIYDPRDTVDSSDFSASTGWSTTTTNGTITFDGEGHVDKTGADSWGTLGLWRTALTTMKVGDVVRMAVKGTWSSIPESFFWLRFTSGVGVSTGLEGVGYTFHQSGATDYLARQNATAIGDISAGPDTYYDLVFTCNVSGYIDLWATSTGDADWVHIGRNSSQSFDGVDFYPGGEIYANGATFTMDNYSWLQLPEATAGGGGDGASIGLMHRILKRRRN